MRFLGAVVLAALAGSAFAAGSEPARGRLCVTGSECRDAICGNTVVAAAHEIRTYTFALRDATELRWEFRRGERESTDGIVLRAPTGSYTLVAEAPHFARFRKTIAVNPTRQTVVAELKPLPSLSGEVIDARTSRAVVGAVLTTDMGGRTTSDAAGKFAVESDPEHWPTTITATADGYADASSFVPPARVGTALPPFALQRGGTVRATLEGESAGDVTAIELLRIVNQGHTLGSAVRTIPIAAGAQKSPVSFENIEPGDYLVLAKGEREWERFGVPVVVEARQELSVKLPIVPFHVRFRTSMDGEPVRSARLVLRNRDVRWQGSASTDAAGEADLTLWQGGRMNATLEIPGNVPFMERRTLEDSEDVEWSLEVPSRTITGIAIDGASGKPLPGAAIHLSMKSADGYQLAVSTTADEEGFFRFAPVAYGEHVLKAAAKGHPPVTMAYSFVEPEQRRDLRVVLDEAKTVRVSVVTSQGVPVANARALDFSGMVKRGAGTTDAAGLVDVLVPADEVRDLYVVPRDGSFGVLQLRGGIGEAVARIPDGTARIVLRTQSEAHAPIPNVSVLIRYDGRVLPFEVMQALAREQGNRTRSGADGRIVLDHMPAGVYELWPVGSAAELVSLSAGIGTAAPVRITAAPGENTAVMTFAAVDAK